MLPAFEPLLLPFVNAGVVAVGALAVVYLLRVPRRKRADARGGDLGEPGDAWREQAKALAGEARSTVSTFDRPVDSDRVSRDLLPLAARIRGHVRSAPRTVDRELHRRLFELGIACQAVAIELRPGDVARGRQSVDELLEALQAEAAGIEGRIDVVE